MGTSIPYVPTATISVGLTGNIAPLARTTLLLESFDPHPLVQLLVFQPTPFCNINCDYCYLPNRNTKKRISIAVIEAAVASVVSSHRLGKELSVVWHAGEPLVVPHQFYRTAFERIRQLIPPEVTVRHSIQTNGILIDDEWCALFNEFDVRVGVSIDGPAFIHDAHRKSRGGKGTHVDVMKGVDRLRRHDVPFHAIAVVTADSLAHPDEIFSFFSALGAIEVGFNIDEEEGINLRSTLEDKEPLFRQFLKEIFDHAVGLETTLRVREFERARGAILRGIGSYVVDGAEYPNNAQVTPCSILTVDCDGNLSMFSPELLGQSAPKYDNFVLGNVLSGSIQSALDSKVFQSMYSDIRAGVEKCREQCEHFMVCGGGAPANKYYETGNFRSAETRYCRLAVKAPIDLALAHIEKRLKLTAQ